MAPSLGRTNSASDLDRLQNTIKCNYFFRPGPGHVFRPAGRLDAEAVAALASLWIVLAQCSQPGGGRASVPPELRADLLFSASRVLSRALPLSEYDYV